MRRTISRVPVPDPRGSDGSHTAAKLDRIDYADAFTAEIQSVSPILPEDLFKAFFRASPGWVTALLKLRNRIVGLLGLKTGEEGADFDIDAFRVEPGRALGLFRVFGKSPAEIIVGENDKHLDFRVRFHLAAKPAGGGYDFTLSTLVMTHNALGRAYFALVRPFHGLIVPAMMQSMIRSLEKPRILENRPR